MICGIAVGSSGAAPGMRRLGSSFGLLSFGPWEKIDLKMKLGEVDDG